MSRKNMDNKLQTECIGLIRKYRQANSEELRLRHRNVFYERMHPYITRWIKEILGRWKKFLPDEEVTSMGWDIFLYCLERYDECKSRLPYFFFNYTRYWLLVHFGKKENVFLPIEELEETLKFSTEAEGAIFLKLLALHRLREEIPEKYRIVWDDAFMSLSSANKERQVSLRPGMGNSTYRSIKEILKPIIRFLLKDGF